METKVTHSWRLYNTKPVAFYVTLEGKIPRTPNVDTYGDTERIIGNWISRNESKRSDIVLMTKIAGSGLNYIRNAGPITADAIANALTYSLERLKTDYIDVYQLHWPNRVTPHFGKHWPDVLIQPKPIEKKNWMVCVISF